MITSPSESAVLVDYDNCIEESITIGMGSMYEVGKRRDEMIEVVGVRR